MLVWFACVSLACASIGLACVSMAIGLACVSMVCMC